MSNLTYGVALNATTSALLQCSFEVGGLCYDEPRSNKGFVVYGE